MQNGRATLSLIVSTLAATLCLCSSSVGAMVLDYSAQAYAEAHTVAFSPNTQDSDDIMLSQDAINAPAWSEVFSESYAAEAVQQPPGIIDVQTARIGAMAWGTAVGEQVNLCNILTMEHNVNHGGSALARGTIHASLSSTAPELYLAGSRVRIGWWPYPEEEWDGVGSPVWDSVNWELVVRDSAQNTLLVLNESSPTGILTNTGASPFDVTFECIATDSELLHDADVTDIISVGIIGLPEPSTLVLAILGFFSFRGGRR